MMSGDGIGQSLTSADIAALTIMLLSAVWGFSRGFASEVLGLSAWVGALVGAFQLYGLAIPYVQAHLTDHWLAVGVSFAVSFVGLLIVLSMVAGRLGGAIKGSVSGGVDRVLGIGFGFLRGYVILVVLFLGVHVFFAGWLDGLSRGSRIGPYVQAGATWLDALIPSSYRPALALPSLTGHSPVF